MPTTVLDVYSKAFTSITNRIKASVYLSSSPTAVIASIIDTAIGHPARIYHFPGLNRANYDFSLDEIDGAGIPINNLAYFSVVPGTVDGLLTRNDEQIRVGTTPGFNPGSNTFIFDGTETFVGSGIFKPNYIGWEIVPSELNQRGILIRDDIDYTWDSITATFLLLQPGDILIDDQYYNIHFNPFQNPVGNSVPTTKDFQINILTASTVIDETYFGKKLIVEPSGDYAEITLPNISTVAEGRIMMVEIGGNSLKCVKFIPQGASVIKFLKGNVFALPNESFSIYKYTRSVGNDEWRICESSGYFRECGQITSEDMVSSDVINKQLLDGSSVSVLKNARIYNEVVLNLPISQVCNYDDWSTGLNKYLYSYANSSNPANAGKFHVPDRRNLFERSNLAGKAGDYLDDTIKETTAFIAANSSVANGTSLSSANNLAVQNEGGPGDFKYTLNGTNSVNTVGKVTIGSGTETKPKHYLVNKYVIL